MKKLLFFSLLTILTFAKCTKEKINSVETPVSKDQAPAYLVSRIKEWHESKIILNETMTPSLQNISLEDGLPNVKKDLLIPDYTKATYETLPNGATITTVAANDYKLKNSKVGFFRTFVFLGASNKVADGKIVEFYGDPEFIDKNHKFLVSNYNNNKTIKGFTGSIFTYDVYYRPLRARNYKNGKVTSAITGIVKKPTSQNKRGDANEMLSSGNCQTQEARTTQCYDVYWVTADDIYLIDQYCCDETGAGGGGTTNPPVSINPITGLPTNPIDGQVVFYFEPNGYKVELTYSAETQLWLLREVQVLREVGYSIAIVAATPIIVGGILTSVAIQGVTDFQSVVISLGVLSAYTNAGYIYEFATWYNNRPSVKEREEYCQSYNVPCIRDQGVGGVWLDCINCYIACVNDGIWPYGTCPVVAEQS